MTKRMIPAVLLPLLVVACSSGSSGGTNRGETPFSGIGDPVGNHLGQVLFTLRDGTGRVALRIETLGPNPVGSPVSCGRSEHPVGTRLVPLYINGTSADPGVGVADIDVKIVMTAGRETEPLLLTRQGGSYVPSCAKTPAVHLDGMKAGVQHVIRGVGIVTRAARQVTVVLTAPDGSVQRRRIAV